MVSLKKNFIEFCKAEHNILFHGLYVVYSLSLLLTSLPPFLLLLLMKRGKYHVCRESEMLGAPEANKFLNKGDHCSYVWANVISFSKQYSRLLANPSKQNSVK